MSDDALPPAVAVVGLAGRFPGAPDLDAFWRNLRDGVESISFFSVEDLAAAGVEPALLAHPAYVRAAPLLDGIDLFDANFFGYTPREAETLDPQQRLFLETAWEALETAGYSSRALRERVGVYAGSSMNGYLVNLYSNPHIAETVGEFQLALRNEKDYLTTRASYKLGLRGPSLSINTACSTSLVALHVACQGLLGGECDVALAGGVAVNVPHKTGYLYREGGIHSPDGHCRAFDARARGTVNSNGVGVVVLKRLEDALAARDTIHAVIRGSAVNNDGALKAGFTAPSEVGQAEAIAEAQAMAGVHPDEISYIEAHGTGTPLGDPIEIAALTSVFRAKTDRRAFCALGAVKTNIGHTGTAAGIAGFLKTVLALKHRALPPTVHYRTPNPQIDFAASPFFVNDRPCPWAAPPGKRRVAGVSSFGIGGTNAHVIVEEAPPRPPSAPGRPRQLLVLSAKSAPALDASARRLAACLRGPQAPPLADAAFTLAAGRWTHERRRALVASDAEGAAQTLDTAAPSVAARPRRVALLFPGQGAQRARMGREIYEHEPVYREHFDHCCRLLAPALARDVRALTLEGGDANEAAAERTDLAQPALFAVEYALARLWMHWGVRPAAMLGHSIGEFVAACLAGVFSLDDALALVAARGRLMQALPPGTMLSVAAPASLVAPRLPASAAIAADNGPSRCVVAGPPPDVNALREALQSEGVVCRELRSTRAFHSPAMAPIVAEFAELVGRTRRSPPNLPYVSNLTGRWIDPSEAIDPSYWGRHLREPVRFAAGVATLLQGGADLLLEAGPGRALTSLAGPALAATDAIAIASLANAQDDEHSALLHALGRAWCAGLDVDWGRFYEHEHRGRVPLPTYPFQRSRFWVERQRGAAPRSTEASAQPAPERTKAAQPSIEHIDAALGNIDTINASPRPPNTSVQGEPVRVVATTADEPTPARRARVAERLRDILHRFSGIALSALEGGRSFFELDLDSLLLVQTNHALREEFGVEIPVVRLMDDLSTIDALAAHIASALPPAWLAPQGAPTAPASLAGSAALTENATLAGGATPIVSAGDTAPTASLGHATPTASAGSVAPSPAPTATGRLSERQRAHVATLVERYTAKTAGSKAVAARDHEVLADRRSSLGFRPLWKEMVYPIAGRRAEGGRLWDVDGNEYVDLTMGFGVGLFGHSPPFVREALESQLRQGVYLGPQSPVAGEVAALVAELTGMPRVALCNSGTDAVMAALRLARTATGRRRIALFAGSYHGVFDGVLARRHPTDGDRRSIPSASGVPDGVGADVVVFEYGTAASLEAIARQVDSLAAVLVEPVQSRRPDLQPVEFLRELRQQTAREGCALIFDEMITGFRVHPGGAQAHFGVRADIATYGKVLGAGLPIGVVAGEARYLNALDGGPWRFGDDSSPSTEQTAFAGTYNKNPLSMAAAHAVLRELRRRGPTLQEGLNRRTERFAARLNGAFEAAGVPLRIVYFGSLFSLRPLREPEYVDLLRFHLVSRGVYVWEGNLCFWSDAHTDRDVEFVIEAIEASVAALREGGFLAPAADQSAQTSPPAAGARALPTTETQRQIWAASQLSEDALVAYNESVAIGLRGPLEVEVMRRALRTLAGRHGALRTTFDADGEVQRVAPSASLDLTLVDLRSSPPAEAESALSHALEREARHPFNLERGPLARATLLRRSEESHVLVLTMHHLVTDEWSSAVLFDELAALYAAERAGRAAVLPPPGEMLTYVERERRLAASPDESARAFWAEQLAPPWPARPLPPDRARQEGVVRPAAVARLTLGDDALAALRRHAAAAGGSLYAASLATFALLLHHVTGSDDVLFATHFAGQADVDGARLVGLCVKLLPFRSRLDPSALLAEHFARSRRAMLGAFTHRDFPWAELARVASGRPGAPPLRVAFNRRREDEGSLRLDGLEVTVASNPTGFAKWDLSWTMVELPGGLAVECIYDHGQFEVATVARWMSAFEQLAASEADERASALFARLDERAREARAAAALALEQESARRLKSVRRRPSSLSGGES
ncbi:MAG: aminotransferase class III-fold pyridoxal phosphate-dependent enzyme [Polyangiaceae bacterium]|jgi:acyl transferase domain-containing protein|nr:aminotransferase class III-fold pyridoxal phosphate-dependent enzyme [Polyangiaceae bacterium]